jgi:peptidoglycan LD-endopeptidase LytH
LSQEGPRIARIATPFVSGLRVGLLVSTAFLAVSLWWRSARGSILAPSSARPGSAIVDAPMPDDNGRAAMLTGSDVDRLQARRLLFPVDPYDLRQLRDNFRESRGTRLHSAIDLMAPRGTRVRAVDDGVVRRLLTSGRGGISIYHFDPENRYCYFYAHLDRYAPFLVEGKLVRKGELLGYVGSTGNASATAPHLHFAIFKLDSQQRWWEGTPINPYVLWASVVE